MLKVEPVCKLSVPLPARVDAGIAADEAAIMPHEPMRVTRPGLQLDRHHRACKTSQGTFRLELKAHLSAHSARGRHRAASKRCLVCDSDFISPERARRWTMGRDMEPMRPASRPTRLRFM